MYGSSPLQVKTNCRNAWHLRKLLHFPDQLVMHTSNTGNVLNKTYINYSVPITIRTYSRVLIVFVTVYICRIIESSILSSYRTSSSLIGKVPVKAGVGPMLLTLMLLELRTGFHSKVTKITGTGIKQNQLFIQMSDTPQLIKSAETANTPSNFSYHLLLGIFSL